MDEFSIIEKYFAPLAKDYPQAFGLKDDAAVFSPSLGCEIVLTKDAMVADVHFFANDKPEYIARKLVAVNVSDLAAMGAIPKAYLLALMLPKNTDENWIADFARGLAIAIKEFGGYIIGGDTVVHEGKLALSLTAIGEVPKGKALKKSGAKVGDKIYVSGNIGDSYLGLQILSGKLAMQSHYLKNTYFLPNPKVKLGLQLLDIATSCTDISDGLIADLGHICKSSNVGAIIKAEQIPLSNEAKKSGVSIEKLITGGDDYELLYTIPPHIHPPKGSFYIGDICSDKNIIVLDKNLQPIDINGGGYSHSL
jgi:thiamine-monophosphate kinase